MFVMKLLTPPGHEHAEADGLEDAGKSTNGDGVERALLGEDLGDELDISLAGDRRTY